jgi:hypothetical protein
MEQREFKKTIHTGNIEYGKTHKYGEQYRSDNLFVFEQIIAEQRFLIVPSGKNIYKPRLCSSHLLRPEKPCCPAPAGFHDFTLSKVSVKIKPYHHHTT